jgi:hypothetical protein
MRVNSCSVFEDKRKLPFFGLCTTFVSLMFAVGALAQSPSPYPDATTDRALHIKTAMAPPVANIPFTDPDFGSSMVRATDETTDYIHTGGYLMTQGSGQQNEWSADTGKFWVAGQGGRLFAFAFDAPTMKIHSLPLAPAGKGLLVPLRLGATFSFTDPDLIYGTTSPSPLTISSYRFSTGKSAGVIDTTTCGTQPALDPKGRSDDDVGVSLNSGRFSISEGGQQQGAHQFVVVYDKKLGCRWYNTETGQVGGAWGPTGTAIGPTVPYLVRHAYISKSGNYVRIMNNGQGFYVWDIATLKVSPCGHKSGLECFGYGVTGYNSYVNASAVVEYMQMVKRPLGNLADMSQLYLPFDDPHEFEITLHFSWSNVDKHDSTPVCASSYQYEGESEITEPFEGEIFCAETDGKASTVWRFAHNRANWKAPYFNTQPLGGVSMDGRFFLFTSGWDQQLGIGSDGRPRTDVWIVKLN